MGNCGRWHLASSRIFLAPPRSPQDSRSKMWTLSQIMDCSGWTATCIRCTCSYDNPPALPQPIITDHCAFTICDSTYSKICGPAKLARTILEPAAHHGRGRISLRLDIQRATRHANISLTPDVQRATRQAAILLTPDVQRAAREQHLTKGRGIDQDRTHTKHDRKERVLHGPGSRPGPRGACSRGVPTRARLTIASTATIEERLS